MKRYPGAWNAKWISLSQSPEDDLGVFVFRRSVDLPHRPNRLVAKVSADQRYRLYINGEMAAHGPAKGDAAHWPYDEVDLAPWLEAGRNEIVAVVWNYGRYGPMAQPTVRAGWLCEGEGISTPDEWSVARLEGHGFGMFHTGLDQVYIDVGPGEDVDLGLCSGPWYGATLAEELAWQKPNVIGTADSRGASGGGGPWMLVPRTIPPMRYEFTRSAPKVADRQSGARSSLSLPQPVVMGLLLDYGELLTAYPRLRLRGPRGCEVKLSYMEALASPEGGKGHRDDVVGKSVVAHQDRITLSGGEDRYEPLWWRTYRYLFLEADGEVELTAIDAMETGYPYSVESSFESDDSEGEAIWDVAVRTAKRCAGETFFDCPYYEQLQYAGDTRIQAMIAYYLGRDRRLTQQAIEQFAWSITPEGLTQSRYPSRQMQMIPPFSLWWVLMVHDQWLYDRLPLTDARIRQMHGVIAAYRELEADGEATFWDFADWIPGWWAGEPSGRLAAPVHRATRAWAELALAEMTGDRSELSRMRAVVASWPVAADGWITVEGARESRRDEHSQAIARLCRRTAGLPEVPWPSNPFDDLCTFYFQYYRHQAMRSEDYFAELGDWRAMIGRGLTTFAEMPEPTRSDCHAWSAHPVVGFFQQVAGVTSSAPGWRRARVAPRPGSAKRFLATIAHPDGELKVAYENGSLMVESPVPFTIEWNGRTEECDSGAWRG